MTFKCLQVIYVGDYIECLLMMYVDDVLNVFGDINIKDVLDVFVRCLYIDDVFECLSSNVC